MRKIILKAVIAIALAALLTTADKKGVGFGILLTIFMYILISWFGMIYQALYGFGGVLRCLVSFFGSVLIIVIPSYILEAILPEGWFRTFLMTIATIVMLIIPFVRDWKSYRTEI